MDDDFLIHRMFSRVAASRPDAPAVQMKREGEWRRFSYRQLREMAYKIYWFLREEGCPPHSCAALILENSPEWMGIYLGMMYAGVVCVPLDCQLGPQEILVCVKDSQARVVFTSRQIFTEKFRLADAAGSPRVVVTGAGSSGGPCLDLEHLLSRIEPREADTAAVSPDDTASLIYTSGTTGQPKGVMLSHRNICANFHSIVQMDICRPSDSMLSLLPLHHSYPFMVTCMVPLLLGARVTCMPLGFKPADLAAVMREAGITMFVGVPQLFSLLHVSIFAKIKAIPAVLRPALLPFIRARVRRQFGGRVRLFVSGGARLDQKTARDLTRWGLRLIEGYGLTEASPVVSFNPLRRPRPGSAGKAIPGVQIRILDPDGNGEGQILVRGASVMKGYYKDESLTAETIRDGWLYTGDLGYLDNRGYLFITGREKEVIVLASGKNVYPEELESYYGRSPYIKEMCVVARAGDGGGESLFAVIRPDLDYFREKNETTIGSKIRWELENAAKDLPAYKHIMGFTLVKEELPRTTLKKLQRYEVRRRYITAAPATLTGFERTDELRSAALSGTGDPAELRRAGAAQEPRGFVTVEQDSGLLARNDTRVIIGCISGRVRRTVGLDSHLEIDLGIDSLTRVEIGLGIEEALKIHIPDDILYSAATVRDLVLNVTSLAGANPDAVRSSWRDILLREPPPRLRQRISLTNSFGSVLLTAAVRVLLVVILKVLCCLRSSNRAAVPARGPLLICPNHASYLDGPAIFCSLPLKSLLNTYFIGYARVFESPFLRWAMRPARLIPIDPSADLVSALQAVALVLAQNKIVCIFPEGRRSVSEEISEFKKGVGILIKELDTPVVPVYIKGSHQAWPRTQRFPGMSPVRVIFGVLHPAGEFKGGQGDDYGAIARKLRQAVESIREGKV